MKRFLTVVLVHLLFPANPGAQSGPPAPPGNLRIVAGLTPGSPSVIVTTAGADQGTAVSTTFLSPLKATVRDAGATPLNGITVTFTAPASGATARFSGSVAATAVTDSRGIATAPALTANGIAGSYAVVASVAGTTATANFALANLPVTQPPPSNGTWTNVTPPGWNPDPNYPTADANYGFQQIVTDRVRPGDFYAFTGYQGVWKSSDFGLTWTMVSTGVNSDAIRGGRNWAAVIDPNPSRDPATPPTLYTQAGYSTIGKMGIWKSTDGGVNWTSVWNTVLASDGVTNITSQVWIDMQGLSIDPANNQHLLAVNHGNTQGGAYDQHIFETTNGGLTWIDRGTPAGGAHCAVSFVTSTTWIATAEGWGPGTPGTFVTNDSGRAWSWVGQMGKGHGNEQLTHLTANGTLYLAAMEGIFRAASPYLSWTRIDDDAAQNIAGTPDYLYASYGWSSIAPVTPKLRRATTVSGMPWDPNYTATPSDMTNGVMGAAVAYNAAIGKYVIVTANRLAGIWRYVE